MDVSKGALALGAFAVGAFLGLLYVAADLIVVEELGWTPSDD